MLPRLLIAFALSLISLPLLAIDGRLEGVSVNSYL